MNKINLDNRGFGKKEMMIVMVIVIAAIVFVTYKTLDLGGNAQITNFRRLADNFLGNASRLRDVEAHFSERVFLYDVINENYSDPIKSPFNKSEECDVYESKIQMKSGRTYITFKCGEYLINDQNTLAEQLDVYKVGEWTEKVLEGENIQTAKFYNYLSNGVEQFPEYYIEKEFLVEYKKKTGMTTYSVTNLGKKHQLVEKNYYRTFEKVE